jgi:hypothetical protein
MARSASELGQQVTGRDSDRVILQNPHIDRAVMPKNASPVFFTPFQFSLKYMTA